MKSIRMFLGLVGAVMSLLGTAFGVVWFTDNRYAMASEQKSLEIEVEELKAQKALEDALEELYHQKKMTRRYPNDPDFQQKAQEAEDDVKSIKRKLDTLDKKRELLESKPSEE